VFVGTVDEVDVPWVMRPEVAEPFAEFPLSAAYVIDHEIRVRFEVEQRFKGALGQQVWVNTGDFPGYDCESPNMFTGSAERWLVFAYEQSDGELHVSNCLYPVGEQGRPDEFVERISELPVGSGEAHPVAAWSTYEGREVWRYGAMLVGLLVLPLLIRRLVFTGRPSGGTLPRNDPRSGQ